MQTKRHLKRPAKSHAVGDSAALQISEICLQHGWAVQEVRRDYGEDLLVQPINDDESVEHFRLWIQSKGVGDLSKHRLQNGNYSHSISFAHAYKWLRSADLCIVVLWDTNKREGVYSIPSHQIDEEWLYVKQPGSVTIHFPSENRFSASEMGKISWLCRVHHYTNLIAAAHFELEDSQDNIGLLWSRVLDFLVSLGVFKINVETGLEVDATFLAHTKVAFLHFSKERLTDSPEELLHQAMMLTLVVHFEKVTGIQGLHKSLAICCENFLATAIPILKLQGVLE